VLKEEIWKEMLKNDGGSNVESHYYSRENYQKMEMEMENKGIVV